jgi:hypothetical protein
MKKFFFTLFIILTLSCTVFLLGWAQISVPPASYGVIISKTHGFDPLPVQSGQFRWIWYKLIPTNVQIPVFRLEKTQSTINVSGTLPSSENYAVFAGFGVNFDWELNLTLSFTMNSNKLVDIISKHNIVSQEALDAYQLEIVHGIEAIIIRTLSSSDIDISRVENILAGNPDKELDDLVYRQYPEITGFSMRVHNAKIPNFALYRSARQLYAEYLAKQHEYISSSLNQKAENHIEAQIRFDELERYGQLLTKYPILLQYITMEKE